MNTPYDFKNSTSHYFKGLKLSKFLLDRGISVLLLFPILLTTIETWFIK